MDKKSAIATVMFGVVFCAASFMFGYSRGEMDTLKVYIPKVGIAETRAYKEGQLDALNGKQIYEKATFDDGAIIIVEKNDEEENGM
jgi:hypothetical protein